jgi:hypothetical protein
LQLGSLLLKGLGVRSDDVSFLRALMHESMELRARETIEKKESKEADYVVSFQVILLTYNSKGWKESVSSFVQKQGND